MESENKTGHWQQMLKKKNNFKVEFTRISYDKLQIDKLAF